MLVSNELIQVKWNCNYGTALDILHISWPHQIFITVLCIAYWDHFEAGGKFTLSIMIRRQISCTFYNVIVYLMI